MIRNLSDKNGQLLVVAGVIITIMIVVASIATINISSVTQPIDKSGFIRKEFENVRSDFGFYLDDMLISEILEDPVELNKVFNDSVRLFKFAEARHNYYFDAELKDIITYSDAPDVLKVNLTLKDLDDSISEFVYYHIK